MKNNIIIFLVVAVFFTACKSGGSLSRFPAVDRPVYELMQQYSKTPDSNLLSQINSAYNSALQDHLQKINQYKNSGQENSWEKVMREYGYLQTLADGLAAFPVSQNIKIKRFDDEYAQAKEKVLNNKYEAALSYLNNNNRHDARRAYDLLREVKRIEPGYKDVNRVLKEAESRSILNIVINPVNYYAQSYGYWGLQSDNIQEQIARDVRSQVGSGTVRVYTELEARRRQVFPDRLVDISWNELFVPIPNTHTYSRNVSKQIQTGTNSENKPIYTTVNATVFVVQKSIVARGNLELRITEPATNRQIVWDNFPAQYSWNEEYASYQGDSRALDASDWALINRANNFIDPSRSYIYNQVFSQVYPRLLSRIRSVTW
jgi:hypothetical protein